VTEVDLAGPQALRDERRHDAVPARERGLVPMSPCEWLAELRDALPDPAVTVLDGNIVMTAAQRLLPVRHPVHRLTPGPGHLGPALAEALACSVPACIDVLTHEHTSVSPIL